MDPLTLTLLICLAAGWVIRNAAEDGWAGIHGRESPRIARRRARLQLADATGSPTIGQAVAGRLANRIANPPERRALTAAREYLDEVIADAWEDARTGHAERRRKRLDRADDTRPDPDGALKTRQCRGCDVLVVKPREWCDACEYAEVDDPEPQPEATQIHYCAGCGAEVAVSGQRCPDCAWVDYDRQHRRDSDQLPDPAPGNTAPEIPEPDPAPDTTRKDAPPVSTPTEINGDTSSPLEALAFATTCHDLNAAVQNELDAMANNLEGEGVTGHPIQMIRDAWSAAETFGLAALDARNEYARHVATQADIAGNAELRDTVRDTYLDAARA